MITSILNGCLLLKNEPPNKLQEYFHSINLTIFNSIFHKSSDAREANQKILFILCAYSEDSPMVILRQDAKEEKQGICDYLDLPEYLRQPLIELSDLDVRRATTQYLTQFAGPLFKSLMFMRIQYEDFELGVTNKSYTIKTSKTTGETTTTEEVFDIKEHGKAVAEMARLAKQISIVEKEIKGSGTYRAINEMKEYKFHNLDKKIVSVKEGIGIESSKLIRIGRHGS